jgi:HCOMODA/2-hydroxy-3-carboxy-muconic semialdehyde decarboxylase
MASLRRDLVTGNRIFAHHGILDAYGHLSVRDPEHADRFIMSRARAPELVTEDDLMTFDLEGQQMTRDARSPYQERFIHAAIYEARPEVQAIVHCHTPSILPFSVIDVPLRAMYHMAGPIGVEVPVWDIAEEFGSETNMLVINMAQGRSLARTLGGNRMALMRGHGGVLAGNDVPEVVRAGVYMDINARALTAAHLMSGGKVHLLSDAEVRARIPAPGTQPGREWEAWCAQVGRSR